MSTSFILMPKHITDNAHETVRQAFLEEQKQVTFTKQLVKRQEAKKRMLAMFGTTNMFEARRNDQLTYGV